MNSRRQGNLTVDILIRNLGENFALQNFPAWHTVLQLGSLDNAAATILPDKVNSPSWYK